MPTPRCRDYVNQHVGSHCIRRLRGQPWQYPAIAPFASLTCRISYGAPVTAALETIYHL